MERAAITAKHRQLLADWEHFKAQQQRCHHKEAFMEKMLKASRALSPEEALANQCRYPAPNQNSSHLHKFLHYTLKPNDLAIISQLVTNLFKGKYYSLSFKSFYISAVNKSDDSCECVECVKSRDIPSCENHNSLDLNQPHTIPNGSESGRPTLCECHFCNTLIPTSSVSIFYVFIFAYSFNLFFD